jgi:hypothetical protein
LNFCDGRLFAGTPHFRRNSIPHLSEQVADPGIREGRIFSRSRGSHGLGTEDEDEQSFSSSTPVADAALERAVRAFAGTWQETVAILHMNLRQRSTFVDGSQTQTDSDEV